MTLFLKNWLRIWLYCMAALAGAMSGILIYGWHAIDMPTRLMMILSIVLAVHVLEEWKFPGGFYYIYNKIMHSDDTDRYPMNQITDMLTNVGGEIFFIAFLLCGVSLSLMTVVFFFSLVECLIHLIILPAKSKKWFHTFYNPGFWTSLCGYMPLGICTLILAIHSGAGPYHFAVGALITFLLIFVCIVLNERLLRNKNSRYGFFKDYGYGFYSRYVH